MRPDVERRLSAALPALRGSWSLMLAACLALAGLGALALPVDPPPGSGASRALVAACVGLGVLSAAATLWLDRALLAPERTAGLAAIPDHGLAQRHLLAGHLALWSLAVVPSLLGFAQLLLAGTLTAHLALCALSLVILALLLPTRARIAARLESALR